MALLQLLGLKVNHIENNCLQQGLIILILLLNDYYDTQLLCYNSVKIILISI